MAIEDPSLEEPDPIIEVLDLVFLIVFSIEMVLKIIAMGFVMEAHSYLRDPWNIVSEHFIFTFSLLTTYYFIR